MNFKPVDTFLDKYFERKENPDEFKNVIIKRVRRRPKEREIPAIMNISKEGILSFNPKEPLLKGFMETNYTANLDTTQPLTIFDNKPTATYYGEFLADVFRMCRYYEKVKITMDKDFPIKVETEDFVIVLAPRDVEK